MISEWISSNHNWENTIFSDEKKFTIDGPDCWMSHVPKNPRCIRNKHQCGGGKIMVWMMIFPNGLLSFHVINEKFKSANYIGLLKNYAVPIILLFKVYTCKVIVHNLYLLYCVNCEFIT